MKQIKTNLKTTTSFYDKPQDCTKILKVEVETYGGWTELPSIQITRKIDGVDHLIGFSLYEVFSSGSEQLRLTYE